MIFKNDPIETFARFWLAYPRHRARKQALIAWCRLDPDEALVNIIIDALAWQRAQADWTKSDGAFVPYPATWINGERWNDEKPQPGTPSRTPVMLTRFASLGMHRENR